jgi:hypothetical protein
MGVSPSAENKSRMSRTGRITFGERTYIILADGRPAAYRHTNIIRFIVFIVVDSAILFLSLPESE